MTYNEFLIDIYDLVQECPKCWRKGQSVFNVVDAKYGVARDCQFKYGIDCFYDDSQIDNFLKKSFELINNEQSNQYNQIETS